MEKKYTHTHAHACGDTHRSTHTLTDLIGNENDPSVSVLQETKVNNGGSHIKTLRQKCNYCFSIDPNFQQGTHC